MTDHAINFKGADKPGYIELPEAVGLKYIYLTEVWVEKMLFGVIKYWIKEWVLFFTDLPPQQRSVDEFKNFAGRKTRWPHFRWCLSNPRTPSNVAAPRADSRGKHLGDHVQKGKDQ